MTDAQTLIGHLFLINRHPKGGKMKSCQMPSIGILALLILSLPEPLLALPKFQPTMLPLPESALDSEKEIFQEVVDIDL